MQADEIGKLENLVEIALEFHARKIFAVQHFCGVERAVCGGDFHSERKRHFCGLFCNLSEAYKPQRFAGNFKARKCAFAFFDGGFEVVVGRQRLHPEERVLNVPCGKEHARNRKLRNRVSVCSRRVENHYAAFCIFFVRYVVYACA